MDWSFLEKLRRREGVMHVQGHRGARGMFPENTLDGIEYALESGIQVIELDVLTTGDGEIVVTHNSNLHTDTTQDESGAWIQSQDIAIRNLTYSELQKFDVGRMHPESSYRKQFSDQCEIDGATIPKLQDVMALMGRPKYISSWLVIEVKSNPYDPGAIGPLSDFVNQLHSLIRSNKMERRVIVQSFDWNLCFEMQKLAPEITSSYLSRIGQPVAGIVNNIYSGSKWMGTHSDAFKVHSLQEIISKAGGKIWASFLGDICKEDVKSAHDFGLLVFVWTVNDLASVDLMIDFEVDGIVTDYPAQVSEHILSRGLSPYLPSDTP